MQLLSATLCDLTAPRAPADDRRGMSHLLRLSAYTARSMSCACKVCWLLREAIREEQGVGRFKTAALFGLETVIRVVADGVQHSEPTTHSAATPSSGTVWKLATPGLLVKEEKEFPFSDLGPWGLHGEAHWKP